MDFEFTILDFIQSLRTPVGDKIFSLITHLGDAGLLWIVLVLLLLIKPKTRKIALVAAIALLLDVILCNGIIKPIVARTRPCDINTAVELLIKHPSDYSFPSGHSAASFSFTFAMLFAAIKKTFFRKEERLIAKKIFICSLITSVVIAFSRLYLYVHFPTDVLAGIVLGLLLGFVATKIIPLIPLREESSESEC